MKKTNALLTILIIVMASGFLIFGISGEEKDKSMHIGNRDILLSLSVDNR